MIITKDQPFTKEEIKNLSEEFETYIKTVIDIEKKICSAGANRHFENEKVLLDEGSDQQNLWGGGVDLETLIVDYNSMINIRPKDDNLSNEIQDSERRKRYEELTRFFFRVLWTN